MLENVTEQIKTRKSVRSFEEKCLEEAVIRKLEAFAKEIKNPFDIPVEFKFLSAKENGLVCPVATNAELYMGGKVKKISNANLAFGYSFEAFILFAQSLGLGTVWLGGTMNRAAFERAMELEADEMMPCATPIGYGAKKQSMRESLMRKAIKADERIAFNELFFKNTFDTPLTSESAKELALAFEMTRLAPSAVNKQPWRAVFCENEKTVHFYLKRSKGFSNSDGMDMQMIDMGIALCHFELTAKECNLKLAFKQTPPALNSGGLEYIASYEVL